MTGSPLLLFKRRSGPRVSDLFVGFTPSNVSYSRASTGGYWDKSGMWVIGVENEPRFYYNPISHALLGLMIEPQSTSKILYSDVLANASWTASLLSAISDNAGVSPIKGATASKITASATSGIHRVYQSTILTGTDAVISCLLKAGTKRYAALKAGNSKRLGVNFDLQTGLVTAYNSEGSPEYTDYGIEDVGGGWYYCWVSCSIINGETGVYAVCVSNSEMPTWLFACPSYAAVPTDHIFIKRVCVEERATPSSLILSTSATTRAADLLTFTIPSGVSTLRYTFDDNSTQDVAVSAGAYTVPTNLNRAIIKSIASV